VLSARQGAMLNAGMVNAGSSYFPPPLFCESFRVIGRFLRFQNPFKYTRRSRINPKCGLIAPAVARIAHLYQGFRFASRALTES
jgi:hypothetical protein